MSASLDSYNHLLAAIRAAQSEGIDVLHLVELNEQSKADGRTFDQIALQAMSDSASADIKSALKDGASH